MFLKIALLVLIVINFVSSVRLINKIEFYFISIAKLCFEESSEARYSKILFEKQISELTPFTLDEAAKVHYLNVFSLVIIVSNLWKSIVQKKT